LYLSRVNPACKTPFLTDQQIADLHRNLRLVVNTSGTVRSPHVCASALSLTRECVGPFDS